MNVGPLECCGNRLDSAIIAKIKGSSGANTRSQERRCFVVFKQLSCSSSQVSKDRVIQRERVVNRPIWAVSYNGSREAHEESRAPAVVSTHRWSEV
jgi:hypothetical protein